MNEPTQPTSAEDAAAKKVRQVELVISTLLRVGVIASLTVIVFGTVVTFVHHRDYLHSKDSLAPLTTSGTAFPHTMGELGKDLMMFEGRAIVVLGLMLLIATPVLRVAVSIFAFIYEKDAFFVVVTSIVLALLLLSFFLGKAGG